MKIGFAIAGGLGGAVAVLSGLTGWHAIGLAALVAAVAGWLMQAIREKT